MSVATAYGIRRTATMNSNSVWFVTAGYTNAMTTVSTAVSAKTGLLRIGSDSSNLRYLPIRVYGLRIYESDAPTRNYVPIVTNGVPGLVDKIGGGVIYPKTYNGSDYRCLVAEAGGNFANCTDGSDEAYLEFPGTGSGISTGIKITPESCVEADFSLWNTYKLASGNEWIINQDSGCYLALAAAADNNFWWQYCDYPASGSPSTVSSGVSVQNARLQWKFDSPNNLLTVRRGGTLLKNIEITSTRTRTDGKDNKITIGQSNAHMRLYSFKITTAGNVVRDYIPYVTNGVAGLYDLCGKKFYPLSGGKVSGAKRGGVTYQERPFAVYGKSGGAVTATISCKAAGAQSYQWYVNGELLAGETSDEIVVTKASQGGSNSAVYSVRPVYEVFNETDVGEEATITVTLPVSGLMTIFK